MSKPWITHASQDFAEQYIPEEAGVVCISIDSPEYTKDISLSSAFEKILRLKFDDVLDNNEAMTDRLTREEQLAEFGYVPPTQDDANKIKAFLTENRGKHIFVHCAAGISRSGAVAEIVTRLFPEYEDMGHNLSGKPMRFPNVTLLRQLNIAFGNVPIGSRKR